MAAPQPLDWKNAIEAFVAGGFPWIGQLKELKIHFERTNFDCKSVYNFFASLFSLSVYLYCVYTPAARFLTWPSWAWFIVLAFVLTVLYLVLLLTFGDAVKKGALKPLFLNFVIYVLIFVSLTAGFSLLRLLSGYVLVEGRVTADVSRQPISGAYVQFEARGGAVAEWAVTDADGKFSVYIDRDRANNVGRITFTAPGYIDENLSQPGDTPLHPRYDAVHMKELK